VQSALAHGLKPPGERGKHPALGHHCEQQMLDWIQQNAEQSAPVTKTEIKYYCPGQLKVPVTRGWVNSFVRSDRGRRSRSFLAKSARSSWNRFMGTGSRDWIG
jgi:hypothetical protein